MWMKHITLLTIDQLLSRTIVLKYYKLTITNRPDILYPPHEDGIDSFVDSVM